MKELFDTYNKTIKDLSETNKIQNKVLAELAKKVHELEKQVMILAPGVFLELKNEEKESN